MAVIYQSNRASFLLSVASSIAHSIETVFPSAKLLLAGVLLAGVLLASNPSQASEIWDRYIAARAGDLPLPLPDFAYAGYRRGEADIPDPDWPKVSVADYGAAPNDGLSDVQAVRDAIEAAAAMEGAIVTFPPGRFLLSETETALEPPLSITGDYLILRGAGSGDGGTELFFREHLVSETPDILHSTPAMIVASGSTQSYVGEPVTVLTEGNPLGSFRLTVEDSSDLEPGNIISINLDDERAAAEDALAPHPVDPSFIQFKKGRFRREFHRINRIDGNVLTFKEPLMTDVDAGYRWNVHLMEWGTHFGLEDMVLRGNWKDEFVHHKDIIHDSGWTAISIGKYSDSWVSNIRLIDWNRAVQVRAAISVTVRDLIIEGNRGHHGFSVGGSTGVLMTNVHDRTEGGQFHAFGIANHANGTVFHRSSWDDATTFDAHGMFPYSTLFDVVEGGFSDVKGGSSGLGANRPNHLDNLVFWNFRHLGPASVPFSWWKNNNKRLTFLLPKLVGWHGGLPTFDDASLAVNESFGVPIAVESLYEAQLKLRFGEIPDWLNR